MKVQNKPWSELDSWQVAMRFSTDAKGLNMGAVIISSAIFSRIQDSQKRSDFFFKCEKLNYCGAKIWEIFEKNCASDYDELIKFVDAQKV